MIDLIIKFSLKINKYNINPITQFLIKLLHSKLDILRIKLDVYKIKLDVLKVK